MFTGNVTHFFPPSVNGHGIVIIRIAFFNLDSPDEFAKMGIIKMTKVYPRYLIANYIGRIGLAPILILILNISIDVVFDFELKLLLDLLNFFVKFGIIFLKRFYRFNILPMHLFFTRTILLPVNNSNDDYCQSDNGEQKQHTIGFFC